VTVAPLIIACTLLAAVATGFPAQAQSPEGESEAASLNPLSALDLESLGATRTMPLFTPTRSPPAVQEPVAEPVFVEPQIVVAPEPVPPALRLVGLVVTDSEQMALLADPATGMVHRLRAGDSYEGWILTIVDGRTVAFSNEGREHLLTMFEQFDGPTAAQPGGDPLVVPEPEL
jgi:hypothetical protein